MKKKIPFFFFSFGAHYTLKINHCTVTRTHLCAKNFLRFFFVRTLNLLLLKKKLIFQKNEDAFS